MNDFKGRDYLDITTPQLSPPGRASGNLAGPLVILVAALAGMGGIYYLLDRAIGDRPFVAPAAAAETATADDLTKRQLTAFVERFLPAYYNYSYTLYDENIARIEAMMTPAFQAAYNQRAEDLDFKRKLVSLRVRTDGIRILPGSLAFSGGGDLYYVRLAGTMTFTTGVNGVSGDFPLTLLLAVQKTDEGFLIDNVERLR